MLETTVKIIADSVNPWGKRITTFELQYQRFIHSEFKTHRQFSSSSASSRAIPVAKMIAQVRNSPAMPVHWGANQPGMQAHAEVADVEVAKLLWLAAASDAAKHAEAMVGLGLHKQVANRILEPFQWMRTIMTTTETDNWYELRDHEDADPNIRLLAQKMREAQDNSTPVSLKVGEWHLPYIRDEEYSLFLLSEYLLKVSAARCARVSYLTHDGEKPDAQKDLALFDRLAGSRPLHASPLEHQATPCWPDDDRQGNFRGWAQFRKEWEKQA